MLESWGFQISVFLLLAFTGIGLPLLKTPPKDGARAPYRKAVARELAGALIVLVLSLLVGIIVFFSTADLTL